MIVLLATSRVTDDGEPSRWLPQDLITTAARSTN